ncbi:hypothetical protein [Streptomyces sp. NL15-2K]|nr:MULTISPECIES: hypothetical protein [Actinomycetes]WKX14704.1 hypothetical protein Q4V64_47285 [Kutzneria buriramensis]GCB44151.1 hypothetical protein SNL152K_1436 [Streptomyces sp. NL15-2K]
MAIRMNRGDWVTMRAVERQLSQDTASAPELCTTLKPAAGALVCAKR